MKIKHYIQLSLLPCLLSSPLPLLAAGSLDSSAAPGSTSSYTIGDICDRLDTGAAGSQIPFTEPTAAPGPVGCTLNELMSKAPVEDNTNGATPADVIAGKTFWGLRTDGTWGLQTGTRATAPVAKTDQTTGYITGDDGDLQKGITWPNPRFTDNGDGTVTDNLTNLIWLKNANCNNGQMIWANDLNFANTLFDGSTSHNGGDCDLTDGSVAGDWRLPNWNELRSLIDARYFSPALSNTTGTAQWTAGNPFTNIGGSYWSSTTFANDTNKAWAVNLNDGLVGSANKTLVGFAWPVRGGL